MRIAPLLGPVVVCLLFALAQPALAETKQEYDWCYSSTATDDQSIQGCSAMILSGQYVGTKLASAYENRGFAYNNKHQYDLAIKDLSEAIRLNPRDGHVYNNRGNSYYSKGLYELAIEDCNQAIQLNPKDPTVYRNRGNSYAALGQLDRAIADFDQAIRLDARYANAYYDRSLIKRKNGDAAGADADLAKARQINPRAGK